MYIVGHSSASPARRLVCVCPCRNLKTTGNVPCVLRGTAVSSERCCLCFQCPEPQSNGVQRPQEPKAILYETSSACCPLSLLSETRALAHPLPPPLPGISEHYLTIRLDYPVRCGLSTPTTPCNRSLPVRNASTSVGELYREPTCIGSRSFRLWHRGG